MADTKVSDLTALTAANMATGDLLDVVDVSDTTMAASGTNKKITVADAVTRFGPVYNASVTTQATSFASDTYLVGSSIAIPAGRLQAKSMYRCTFNVVKAAVGGTTQPVINIRFGTAGSTADTSRGTLTYTAMTAVLDDGVFDVWAVFRTVGGGTNTVLQTLGRLTHRLQATGLANAASSEPEIATSAGFDSTVASSIIGLSVNAGAASSWTVSLVAAELYNLA